MADNLEDLLVVLFEKCDTRGSGFIGREELEDVCGTFGICGEDVQVIFEDLDRDGDGRVSFEDFGRRFREFLDLQPRGWTGNEGEIERSRERRKSQLLGLEQQIFSSAGGCGGLQSQMDVEDCKARRMWRIARAGGWEDYKARWMWKIARAGGCGGLLEQVDVEDSWAGWMWRFVGADGCGGFRGKTDVEVHVVRYAELADDIRTGRPGTPDASPRKLRRKFSAEESRDVEEILSKTLGDMQRISDENRKLEVLYRREREERELDVQTLEDELANTVAQAAAKAKEEARREAEAVHLTLRDQMIREREQLQAYFQFFQKADVWLQEQRLKETQEVRRKVEETSDENRHLQMTLTETQTELAMLRSQLAGVRVQYEDKSRQLSSERQQSLEHAHHLDCLRRQIQLLHQANKKLLDANEELRSMVGSETSSGRGRSSSDLPQAVNSIWPGHSQEQFEMELELGVGRLQTEEVGECLREMQHLKASSPDRFPLDRFMEDLDSGLCLRDVESDFDSIPELSYRLPDGSQSQDSLTDLEDQRSGAAGSGGDQRSGAARSGGDQRPVPPDRTFKVVLAGNATVGKSSFITRACRGFFPEHISPTLGVDFFTKMVDLDGRNVAIQLWDTAGETPYN
ncbi:unnamed protein product [Darwinula stevensoni]|uniref:EF-hand domain-containing protein n=1 Tax=Darwinula stevensoni TaxID=69355 RepID=A0A7R9A492_9CRUS|nr:unnamed protein product [Darwinula stevensoni]CAG0892085.1 unnamed protein product [Darwinula stevensoni]